jgi:hypothetical protein
MSAKQKGTAQCKAIAALKRRTPNRNPRLDHQTALDSRAAVDRLLCRRTRNEPGVLMKRTPSWRLWLVAVCLLGGHGATAPLPRRHAPLELTLRIDRDNYIPHEPIFADVSLTNVSGKPLGIMQKGIYVGLEFQVRPERGEWTYISDGIIRCWFGRYLPFDWWQPGQAMRIERLVREEVRDQLAPGRYRLRVSSRVPRWYARWQAEPDLDPVVSNDVGFVVRTPDAAERETIAFLDEKLKERSRWRFWLYVPERLEEIERTTRSGRFRTLVRLHRGEWVGGLAGTEPDAPEQHRRLRAVLSSPDASDHMKGKAAYRLAVSSYDPKRPGSGYRVAEALRLVIDGNYNTSIADDAKRALDALAVMERARAASPGAGSAPPGAPRP